MQKIEQDIYISDAYPGVTLGALALPYGILMVDAPPRPDDGRSWQAALRSLGNSVGRLLVSLDSHADRTLGFRILDCPVISHEETARELNSYPAIFKGQHAGTGAEWETCESLSGLRWMKPTLTFSEYVILEWGEYSIRLEHHPGPNPGAIWLIVPEAGVIFVGDAVLVNQPPFLKNADIPAWIATLNLLLSPTYRDHLIVSGRGGIVNPQIIRDQRNYLKDIQKRLLRLQEQRASPETTENLIPGLLSHIDFPPIQKELYAQRLRHSLRQYYTTHFLPAEEDE